MELNYPDLFVNLKLTLPLPTLFLSISLNLKSNFTSLCVNLIDKDYFISNQICSNVSNIFMGGT